jgi:parallel beta-helix repeat protein
VLLLTGILALAFDIKPVRASGTTYIRADGSIDPPDAPISTVDNVTYTLSGNITSDVDGIVVERSNIIVDGAGYTVQGPGCDGLCPASNGIVLTEGRSNVTIENTNVKNFHDGISLSSSSNNSISGNNITNNTNGIKLDSSPNYNNMSGNNVTNNTNGIVLYSSSNNNISGNNITENGYGVWLYSSSNNNISGNNITNNEEGIYYLLGSSDNRFYHNNFIDNTQQVYFYYSGYTNFWDDGSPSGGNYWSNYSGTDANHDGIGDTPYIIDANNTDNYPLMVQYVIPEFPSFLILPLFFIATLLAVIVHRRKHRQTD